MNCAGIIKFDPPTKEMPLVVPPSLYKEAVKRWGEEEVIKMNIIQDEPVKLK